jgi:hypothetical protein
MGAAAVAGGKVGAVIGTAVGTAAGGVGAAPGAAAGTAIGAGTAALIAAGVTAISGEAEYFAEQAAEDAEAYNDKTQSTVEGIARALASGEIYDTGSGYKMAQGISEADLYAKYGIEDCLVKTSFYGVEGNLGGLQDRHVEEAINILNGK